MYSKPSPDRLDAELSVGRRGTELRAYTIANRSGAELSPHRVDSRQVSVLSRELSLLPDPMNLLCRRG